MGTKISPATQLSKKQMNAIKGGNGFEEYQCHVTLSDGRKVWWKVEAPDVTDAKDYVLSQEGIVAADCGLNPL